MFFVLNQDFHSGYANENSTAYSILASNVKGEVRFTVVSNKVTSNKNTRGKFFSTVATLTSAGQFWQILVRALGGFPVMQQRGLTNSPKKILTMIGSTSVSM